MENVYVVAGVFTTLAIAIIAAAITWTEPVVVGCGIAVMYITALAAVRWARCRIG